MYYFIIISHTMIYTVKLVLPQHLHINFPPFYFPPLTDKLARAARDKSVTVRTELEFRVVVFTGCPKPEDLRLDPGHLWVSIHVLKGSEWINHPVSISKRG